MKAEATTQVIAHLPKSLVARVVAAWPHRYMTRTMQNALSVALNFSEVLAWLEVLVRIARRADAAGHLPPQDRELLRSVEKDLRRHALDGWLDPSWTKR